MKKKTNPTIKLKEKIGNLEWKISQLEDYRSKYSDIKEKYDDEFGKQLFRLQEQNEIKYRDNMQLLEIVRWLINKDTAMDVFVKDEETYRKRNIGR